MILQKVAEILVEVDPQALLDGLAAFQMKMVSEFLTRRFDVGNLIPTTIVMRRCDPALAESWGFVNSSPFCLVLVGF
jgi:hypothetical protein